MVDPWWGFVLLGLGAGVLSGALGLGSGTVLIPALLLIFLLPQKSAQGTALAVMVPMALLGAVRYWQNPAVEVNPRIVVLIIAGALVGALLGTEIADRVPGSVLKKIFAVYIVIIGAKMLITGPKAETQGEMIEGAERPASVATENTDVN